MQIVAIVTTVGSSSSPGSASGSKGGREGALLLPPPLEDDTVAERRLLGGREERSDSPLGSPSVSSSVCASEDSGADERLLFARRLEDCSGLRDSAWL